jgi:hypothetical protein
MEKINFILLVKGHCLLHDIDAESDIPKLSSFCFNESNVCISYTGDQKEKCCIKCAHWRGINLNEVYNQLKQGLVSQAIIDDLKKMNRGKSNKVKKLNKPNRFSEIDIV